MENDFISRESVDELMSTIELPEERYRGDESNRNMFFMGINDAWEAIDRLPAADAVPVVHGEWIVDECDTSDDVPSYSWIDFHCSECNTNYGLEEGQYSWCRYEKIPYNYCPNCGAKMDNGNQKEATQNV